MIRRGHRILGATFKLFFCLCLVTPTPGGAQQSAQPGAQPGAEATAEPPAEEVVSFPGLDAVIPRANAVTVQVTAANAVVDQAAALQNVEQQLAELTVKLKTLEEQFSNWQDVGNWPLNRLMTAKGSYTQLNQEYQELFDTLSEQFAALEGLRDTWAREKTFWQDWQRDLGQARGEVTDEIFDKTLHSIDALLGKIAAASTKLLQKQESFSQGQEVLASRLLLIDSTLVQLRQDTFRRNAYAIFSRDFYRQFTPQLFAEYRANFKSMLKLPDGFWERHGWIAVLQAICTLALAGILLQRRRQSKPISAEWQFFFQHPIAGAVFVSLVATGTLYANLAPSWRWLMLTMATIAGTVLVVEMVAKQRRKRLIIALAVVYLVSEALKISGLPTPAYQLYVILLCALAAPACLLIARRRQRQDPGNFGLYVTSLYLISLFALIGLVTALLGFATLSTHLIHAVLGTIVTLYIVRMTIHLADGGIKEFLRLDWVSERQFIRRLGTGTADRLKTLARIFILINAGLYLLVVWDIYSDTNTAMSSLLSLEYSLGDFTLSVYMVLLISLALYLTNLVSWLVQALADAHYMTPRKMDLGVKTALKRLLHYALFSIGFLVAISMAGLDLQKFTIIAGALGVGIGFGLQNIVNNFVSGLILLFERPVKEGDTINIDGQWGTISHIGLRSTVFETLDRAEIIVPNSDLISQQVTNWTLSSNISRVTLQVGVAYGSNLTRVLSILDTVSREHPDVLEDPEPGAIFTGFGDSSIDFELRAWVAEIGKRLKVKSELGQAIDQHFREAGISIPFPQRDLHLRSIDSNLQSLLGEPRQKTVCKPEGSTE